MSKLIAVLLASGLSMPAWSAGEFYCCKDPADGRRVCGDKLPPACRGQAHQIYDKGGNLLRNVAAPLTAEQKAAALELEKQKKREEEALKEKRRIDQALLNTYASPRDIDIAQGKAEADIKRVMAETQTKLEAAQKRRVKLDQEAEFYQRKTPPPELAKNLRDLEHETKTLQEVIEAKKAELTKVQARFDTDRQRYAELTGAPISPPASSSAAR